MLGGTAFMLGKTWYENRSAAKPAVNEESDLTALRFISTENILDRIKRSEDMHIVDIRPRAEYERLHLIDSEWIGLAEIATYNAPTGQLVVIVTGEENSHDQLREINERFTAKQMSFAFLEGGIRQWIAQGGNVIAVSDPNSYIDRTKVTMIAPEKVIELLQSLVRSTIIDVRGETDFQRSHIPGAINIPLARLEKERKSIPGYGSLFVYGATEDDTFQAGTRLFDMGFIGLRTITGGFAAWNKQGLPTEPSHQP
jgi:rhodanese-related sulfurtransferase